MPQSIHQVSELRTLYDISFYFITRFFENEPTHEEKTDIIHAFKDLFRRRWSMRDINRVIKAFTYEHPNERPDLCQLFQHIKRTETNLIDVDGFYYHNQLRVMPGPPQRILDINSGEITKIEEDYFLEMVASYTVDDMVHYYVKQFQLEYHPSEHKRLVGSFNYLLKTQSLESLLFMIDVAVNTLYSEDRDKSRFNPFKLTDYKTLAEEQRGRKITEQRLSGDDQIVPRKRVLPF